MNPSKHPISHSKGMNVGTWNSDVGTWMNAVGMNAFKYVMFHSPVVHDVWLGNHIHLEV